MTAKPETAAEVLAEMTKRYGSRYWQDRIERALSAQGEAVANPVAWYVFADDEHWATLERNEVDAARDEGLQVRPLVFGDITHPAPARVAEDDGRQAFEQWAGKRWGLDVTRWHDSGEYKSGLTRDWWQCWTESRTALTAALEGGRHG